MGRKAAVGKNTGARCSEFHRSSRTRAFIAVPKDSQRAASKNPRVWVSKDVSERSNIAKADQDEPGGRSRERGRESLGVSGGSSGLAAGRWLQPPGLSPRLPGSPASPAPRPRRTPGSGTRSSPRPRHSRCSCWFRGPHSSSLRRTRPSRRCSAAGKQRPPGPASSS